MTNIVVPMLAVLSSAMQDFRDNIDLSQVPETVDKDNFTEVMIDLMRSHDDINQLAVKASQVNASKVIGETAKANDLVDAETIEDTIQIMIPPYAIISICMEIIQPRLHISRRDLSDCMMQTMIELFNLNKLSTLDAEYGDGTLTKYFKTGDSQ